MKKIIVLGSNSFAGSCYVDYLLNKNYQIYGFSRSLEPSKLLLKYKYNKKIDVKFSIFLSALVAAENIQYMANKMSITKTNITKAVQSYLK